MKLISSLLFIVLAAYSVVLVGTYLFQRQLIYFPSRERISPQAVGLQGVDEVTLGTSTGQRLHCWFADAADGHPTILFFHGNAGSVRDRAHRIRDFSVNGYGIFLAGYPGYGGSDGAPSETSFHEAADLSYRYLIDRGIEPKDIVIYGESIGTAVAVRLAAKVPARALILEAPMTSVAGLAAHHYPYLPVRYLIKDRFLSIDHIDAIEMPLLIMHGDRDTIVPLTDSRTLFERADEPKQFITIDGGSHNDLHLYPTADMATAFIETHR